MILPPLNYLGIIYLWLPCNLYLIYSYAQLFIHKIILGFIFLLLLKACQQFVYFINFFPKNKFLNLLISSIVSFFRYCINFYFYLNYIFFLLLLDLLCCSFDQSFIPF